MNSFDFLDSVIADDFCSAVNRVRKDAGLDIRDQRLLLIDTCGDVSLLNIICRNYRFIASARTGCTAIYQCASDGSFVDLSFKYHSWFYSSETNTERSWCGKAALLMVDQVLPANAIALRQASSWSALISEQSS